MNEQKALTKLCVRVVSGPNWHETYVENCAKKFFPLLEDIVRETAKRTERSEVEIYNPEKRLVGLITTGTNYIKFNVDHETMMKCLVG